VLCRARGQDQSNVRRLNRQPSYQGGHDLGNRRSVEEKSGVTLDDFVDIGVAANDFSILEQPPLIQGFSSDTVPRAFVRTFGGDMHVTWRGYSRDWTSQTRA
jgi:hypothetical protein